MIVTHIIDMSLKSKIFSNAKKPKGFIGKKMVSSMNSGTHERLARWGMSKTDITGDVLDIGCGGGGNIKRMLSIPGVASVKGVDYSDVSVEKSRKVNADAISEGICSITQGNVRQLPFDDDSFDTVTAFETVYFWPEITDSFREVLRVMRPGASFAVTNESNGTDEMSVKFSKIIDGMNLYTVEDLTRIMNDAGFVDIVSYTSDDEGHWICVIGKKN